MTFQVVWRHGCWMESDKLPSATELVAGSLVPDAFHRSLLASVSACMLYEGPLV